MPNGGSRARLLVGIARRATPAALPAHGRDQLRDKPNCEPPRRLSLGSEQNGRPIWSNGAPFEILKAQLLSSARALDYRRQDGHLPPPILTSGCLKGRLTR